MANPSRLLRIAMVMLIAGAVLPFGMVINVLPSTLWLSFVSYIASVAGLFLGMIAIAGVSGERKDRDEGIGV